FKTIIILSTISLSIVIYTNVDKTMLGFLSGNESVGLYAVSYKIVNVILSIITALGMVLLPRLSYYIVEKKENKAKEILLKAFKIVQFFSIPAAFGVFALAKSIIIIMSGGQYVLGTTTLKLLSPIIVINGLANISGIALYSFGKEKITLVSTTMGAIINVIFNLILIPRISYNGAAIGTLIAESFVLFVQIILLYKNTGIFLNIKGIGVNIVGGLGIILTCRIIDLFELPLPIDTITSIIMSILVYFLTLFIGKDKILIEYLTRIIQQTN
ncbi:MAG: oligosaccharide flippase family protein, partial [Candidatus Methanofastidiosa archaeon]|nr:oligosaccharide flippase family protein [Candidatus Methanofastidiosa archaeon]